MDHNPNNCALSDDELASVAGGCTYEKVEEERQYLLDTISKLRTSLGDGLNESTVMWLNTLEIVVRSTNQLSAFSGSGEILRKLIDDLNQNGLGAQVSGNPYLNVLRQELL